MSKKFKTPLDITGFKEDCDKLIPLLEGLGYRKGTDSDMLYTMRGLGLVTNFGDTVGRLGYAVIGGYTRTKVEATNQDLALALAAMVDDDELYAGEWCKFIGDATRFMHGKLYRATKDGWGSKDLFIDDGGIHDGFADSNGGNRTRFRKATVEEILQHFKGPKRAQVDATPTQDITAVRKQPLTPDECIQPIGYKLEQEYPGSDAVGTVYKAYDGVQGSYVYKNGTFEHHLRIEFLSKYPEFFKPIYPPKPVSVTVPYEGGELEIKIGTFNGEKYARTEGYTFVRSELEGLLSRVHIGRDYSGEKGQVVSASFTFGCKGQYKGITGESIQKVIDLL